MIRRATVADPLRVGVLVSGSGSNLQALIDAFAGAAAGRVRLVGVASSKPGVRALERAAAAGVEHAVFERGDDRAARDRRMGDWLAERGAELLVYAGFMEIVTPPFVERFCAINVHPALLPAFPGAHPVEDALAHGARVAGVTVHFVDAGVDSGPILLQEAVPVHYDDDPDSLKARLHPVEHRLLPQAVELLADDRAKVVGRTVYVTAQEGA